MKDVAKEAGVALGTVSKVVNGIPVGEDYRIRVENAIHKLNYQVNSYAQGLKANKTHTAALLVPNTQNPFYASLVYYIHKELAARNYRMLLCCTDNRADSDYVYYEYASEISLIGDINDCDSYFFLTDDPSGLQRSVQIFANEDGSCPDDSDVSADGKVILWSDSALLSSLDLGTYSTTVLGENVTGDSSELVSGLYLGRRCFSSGKTTANLEECEALWKAICEDLKLGNCKTPNVLSAQPWIVNITFRNYRRAIRQNWKQSLLPGIIFCLFLGLYAFMLMLFWYSERFPGWGTIAIFAAGLFLVLMFFSVYWPQIVLFEQTGKQRFYNSILFLIRYFWKTAGCAAIQILYWALMILFLPWTALLLPLTGFWAVLFASHFLIYDTVNEVFHVEDQIAEAFPEQAPFYEDDETWLARKHGELDE
jgi:hypothetical protein